MSSVEMGAVQKQPAPGPETPSPVSPQPPTAAQAPVDTRAEAPAGSDDPVDNNVTPTSMARASFHIFKGYVGAGVFVLPTIHREAGYIGGPVWAAILTFIVIDVSLMLVTVRRKLGTPEVQTYGELVRMVFGPVASTVVNISLALAQFGWCVLYLQLAGGIVKEQAASGGTFLAAVGAGWLITFPMTLFTHHVHGLAAVSFISSVLLAVVILVTFGRAMSEFWSNGTHESCTPVGKVYTWGLFIPQELSALAGIAPMLPVFNSMNEEGKGAFEWVFGRATGLAGMIYMVYGAMGYIAYGDSIDTSLVTMMPMNGFGETMRVLLAIALLLTYPIQFVPGIEVIDRLAGIVHGTVIYKSKSAVAVRIGVTLGIAAIALVVGPDTVDMVLGLIGATLVTMFLFIAPSMLLLHHNYAQENAEESRGSPGYWKAVCTCTPFTFERARAWFYIGFGIFVTAIGVYQSVEKIVDVNEDRDHQGFRPDGPPTGPPPTQIIFVPVTDEPPPATTTTAATTTAVPTTAVATTTLTTSPAATTTPAETTSSSGPTSPATTEETPSGETTAAP